MVVDPTMCQVSDRLITRLGDKEMVSNRLDDNYSPRTREGGLSLVKVVRFGAFTHNWAGLEIGGLLTVKEWLT